MAAESSPILLHVHVRDHEHLHLEGDQYLLRVSNSRIDSLWESCRSSDAILIFERCKINMKPIPSTRSFFQLRFLDNDLHVSRTSKPACDVTYLDYRADVLDLALFSHFRLIDNLKLRGVKLIHNSSLNCKDVVVRKITLSRCEEITKILSALGPSVRDVRVEGSIAQNFDWIRLENSESTIRLILNELDTKEKLLSFGRSLIDNLLMSKATEHRTRSLPLVTLRSRNFVLRLEDIDFD